jgi:hypothetical protein
MNDQQLKDIAARLKVLERDVDRLKAQQFSRIVPLNQYARVLVDLTNHNGGYSVTFPVWNTAGLPNGGITGVWFSLSLIAATAGVVYGAQIFDPDFPSGPTAPVASYAAAIGDRISAGGFTRLSTTGQVTLTLLGASAPAVSQITFDVWAYLV